MMLYIDELRLLAMHCNFGDNFGDTVRDRFEWGLCNENIKKNLLLKKLDKTVKTAVAIETATYDAIELQGQRNKQTVNKIHMKVTTPKRKLRTKQHTLNPLGSHPLVMKIIIF